MSFGTEFASILHPPGTAIDKYKRDRPPSEQPESVPAIFLEAMSVREEVFVKEQGVPLENELDADDPRSFHWVVYASVGTTHASEPSANTDTTPSSNGHQAGHQRHNSRDEERRKSSSTAIRVPVGTIRLVPPPHPPHPAPGSHHKIDNAEDPPRSDSSAESANASTIDTDGAAPHSSHDGEPYIKLGRLAVLPAYRGLGLSRLLVNAALEFAQQHPDLIVPPVEPTEAERLRLEGKHVAEPWNGLVLVHAQVDVEPMWERMGFRRDPEMGVWDEEGIDHVGMWRRLKAVREKPLLGR